MGHTLCDDCWQRHQDNDYYIGYDDENGADPAECSVHPRLDNWRVYRFLTTVQHFQNQAVGYQDDRCPTPITREGGWVHVRNLFCICFDYERAYVDFAVEQGWVDTTETERYVDGVLPRSIRVNAAGDAVIQAWTRNGRGQHGADAVVDMLEEE